MPDSDTEPTGRVLILAVERDPYVRELQAHFLEEAGFDVVFSEDGVAALEMVKKRRPHIVITEIMLPKLDGLALCRQLKQTPDTQDIIVLVFSMLAAESRALEAGADAFLIKPLAEKRLVETVEKLLEKRFPGHRR